jgi:hypothetical protein
LAFHRNALQPPFFTWRSRKGVDAATNNTLKNPFLKNLNETIFKRINDPPLWGERCDGAGTRFYIGVPETVAIPLQHL